VPKAVNGESQDRPFAAIVRGAKADFQFSSSFSLTWLAPVQRKRVFVTVSYVALRLALEEYMIAHSTLDVTVA